MGASWVMGKPVRWFLGACERGQDLQKKEARVGDPCQHRSRACHLTSPPRWPVQVLGLWMERV